MSVQQSQEPAQRTDAQPAQQQQGQQPPAPQSTVKTPATKPQIRDWASI